MNTQLNSDYVDQIVAEYQNLLYKFVFYSTGSRVASEAIVTTVLRKFQQGRLVGIGQIGTKLCLLRATLSEIRAAKNALFNDQKAESKIGELLLNLSLQDREHFILGTLLKLELYELQVLLGDTPHRITQKLKQARLAMAHALRASKKLESSSSSEQ